MTNSRKIYKNFTNITVEEALVGFGSNSTNCSGYADNMLKVIQKKEYTDYEALRLTGLQSLDNRGE